MKKVTKRKADLYMVTRGRHTKSLAEWAKMFEDQLGIPAKTIEYRVLTLGWDAEKALTTPKKEINYNPVRNPRLKKVEVNSVFSKRTVHYRGDKVVRKSKFVTIEWRGQKKSLYDWSLELAPQLGISVDSIETRVLYRNWDIEKAFTTPSQKIC